MSRSAIRSGIRGKEGLISQRPDPRIQVILNQLLIARPPFFDQSDYSKLHYLFATTPFKRHLAPELEQLPLPVLDITFQYHRSFEFGSETFVLDTLQYYDTESLQRYPSITYGAPQGANIVIHVTIPKNVPDIPYSIPIFGQVRAQKPELYQELHRIYSSIPQLRLGSPYLQQLILDQMKLRTGLPGIDIMFWYAWFMKEGPHRMTQPTTCRLRVFLKAEDVYNPSDVPIQRNPDPSNPYVVIGSATMPIIQFFEPTKLGDYPIIEFPSRGYGLDFPYELIRYTDLVSTAGGPSRTIIIGGDTLPETLTKVLALFDQGYAATTQCLFKTPDQVDEYRVRLAQAYSTRRAISYAYMFSGAAYLPGTTVFDRPGPLTRLAQETQWRQICQDRSIGIEALLPIAQELGLRVMPDLTKAELCRRIEQQYERLFGERGRFLARPRTQVWV